MQKFSIPWQPVFALSHLAPANDIRESLRGVWIDSSGPERVVVATNGAVLGAYRTDEPGDGSPAVFLPLAVVLGHGKAKAKGTAAATVTVAADGKSASVELDRVVQHWTPTVGAGSLFGWRRVIPASVSRESAQFNAHLLAAFLKVHRALGGRPTRDENVVLAHNGRGPALVRLGGQENFIGALMPLRSNDPTVTRPEWVGALLPAKEGATA